MSRIQTLRVSFILLVLLGSGACATSADGVTGHWRGSFDIASKAGARHDTAYLILREDHGQLRGSAGPDEKMQKPISQGVIQDGVLTFRVDALPGAVVDFALKDEGDRLLGIATCRPPSTDATVVVSLARVRMHARASNGPAAGQPARKLDEHHPPVMLWRTPDAALCTSTKSFAATP